MEFVLICVVLAIVVAMVARSKGRSGFGWFLYGLLIWPIALTHAILLRRPESRSPDPAPAEPPPRARPDPRDLPPVPAQLPAAPAGKVWKREQAWRMDIRGITKENPDGTPRQEIIAQLEPGTYVAVVPEPDNKFDPHALRYVTHAGATIGYVPAERAEEFAKRIAAGTGVQACIDRIDKIDAGVPFLTPRMRFELWELADAHVRTVLPDPAPLPPLPAIPDPPDAGPPAQRKSPATLVAAVAIGAVFVFAVMSGISSQAPSTSAPAAAPSPIRPALPPVVDMAPPVNVTTRALTREETVELQRLLTARGFDTRGTDGVIGPATRDAVRAFERSRPWRETGQPTTDHLMALRSGR